MLTSNCTINDVVEAHFELNAAYHAKPQGLNFRYGYQTQFVVNYPTLLGSGEPLLVEGGLVGFNLGGEIVESYASGDVIGKKSVGGLVGNNCGKIASSSPGGNVTVSKMVGGLVGANYRSRYVGEYVTGDIESSYSTADVRSRKSTGGLIGFNETEISDSWCTTRSVVGEVGDGSINGVFSFSDMYEQDELGEIDMIISREGWRISHDLNTQTLRLELEGENYSCSEVSPPKAQDLAGAFDGDILGTDEELRASP